MARKSGGEQPRTSTKQVCIPLPNAEIAALVARALRLGGISLGDTPRKGFKTDNYEEAVSAVHKAADRAYKVADEYHRRERPQNE